MQIYTTNLYIRKIIFLLVTIMLYLTYFSTYFSSPTYFQPLLNSTNMPNNVPSYLHSSPNAPILNVKNYGAKGDGITDDTTALNQAFKAGKNKTIYIPAGIYLVSETIFVPSNCTIIGDGNSSLLLAISGFPIGDDLLKIYCESDIVISSIAISGNSEHNTKALGYNDIDGIHLFDIWEGNNIIVENCTFQDNIYAAIRIIKNAENISVKNCTFSEVDCGVLTLGKDNTNNLQITNCTFNGHQNSEPICLGSTGIHTNVTIKGNNIRNKEYATAIHVATGTYDSIHITDNQINNTAVGILLSNASNSEITNNTITNTLLGKGKGISLNNCTNTTVSNNNMSYISQQGLRIDACSNLDIYKNTLTNYGYTGHNFHGFDIRGTCDNISIYENTISRTDNTLSKYGLVTHSSGSVFIYNNTFSNCHILLYDDSSNISVYNNEVSTIKNNGSENKVSN